MARPDQEAIDTFMNITGVNEATALQKLEEHHGNLNGAVNAFFSEGDTNLTRGTSFTSIQEDDMDIDDRVPLQSRSLLPFAGEMNSFSLLDPNFTRSIDSAPVLSPLREVREIPIEVKDETGASTHYGGALTIEDVIETAHEHGPEIRGRVTVDDDETSPNALITLGFEPNAPNIVGEHGYAVDIEEEMIQAASKQDVAMSSQQSDNLRDVDLSSKPPQPHLEDAELAHAISLSLQELEGKVGPLEVGQMPAISHETGNFFSNGRQPQLEPGRTSLQDEIFSCLCLKLGGISSKEHDEAIMLEAAMFGGVPYAPHRLVQKDSSSLLGPYPRSTPHPPSPSLTPQRLIREQQDDEFFAEFFAALQADSAEAAAVAEERRKEDELCRKQQEEEVKGKVGPSEVGQMSTTSQEKGNFFSYGRQPLQDEDEHLEEQPLDRPRRRRVSRAPSSPWQQDKVHDLEDNRRVFPLDKLGASQEEHNEIMIPYAPYLLVENDLSSSLGPYPRRTPRPPSPSLTAQRLIREQQDDEYIENELKGEGASLAEERRKEDQLRRKQQEVTSVGSKVTSETLVSLLMNVNREGEDSNPQWFRTVGGSDRDTILHDTVTTVDGTTCRMSWRLSNELKKKEGVPNVDRESETTICAFKTKIFILVVADGFSIF